MTISPVRLKKYFAKTQQFIQHNKVIICVVALLVASSAAIAVPVAFQNNVSKPSLTPPAKAALVPSGEPATSSNDVSASATQGEVSDKPTSHDMPSPTSKDSQRTTRPSGQSSGTPVTSPPATPETPEQIYDREYRNLHQAYYSLNSIPVRSESGGHIYYTVTLHVTAFNDATFGHPTIFVQLAPSSLNRYSCVNPAGTMATFVYGTGDNTASVSCQVRACPECYYSGGPLPYYGAFSVSTGGIMSNGVPTGMVVSQSYDLTPGYDRPL